MKVKIKKLHREAKVPSYSKPGDAGLDLTCVEWEISPCETKGYYNTGLAIEIPEGYVGLLFPRSSIHKSANRLANCVGVIDSSFRGPIQLVFDLIKDGSMYSEGDRIGQLIIMPYPQIEFEEVEELSSTERGEGGFGHTGN